MSLAPGHNHPVVFRREPDTYTRPIPKRDIGEVTHKRMQLVRELIMSPRKPIESELTYVTRLASKVGMNPIPAHQFLFGPLHRPKMAKDNT